MLGGKKLNQILVTKKIYVTPETKKKEKIYKIELFLSIFLICILSTYYMYAESDRNKSEQVSHIILSQLEDDTINKNTEQPIIIILDEEDANREYEEPNAIDKEIHIGNNTYQVEASLKIPKINLNYPVISETSDELLKISVNKFHGPKPNEAGNYCIVGHNYRNGKMFGRLRELEYGDNIELQDLSGRTINYKVYNKYIVNPTDTSCTSQRGNDGKMLNCRELTLITCTNYGTQRLIVKCREVG